ncbi:MAG: hypothetical protein R6T87_08300, partial [Marinobacter sp.]
MAGWEVLSKKRYEHIHVRFAPAIHGLRDFWKGLPTLPFEQHQYSHYRNATIIEADTSNSLQALWDYFT